MPRRIFITKAFVRVIGGNEMNLSFFSQTNEEKLYGSCETNVKDIYYRFLENIVRKMTYKLKAFCDL